MRRSLIAIAAAGVLLAGGSAVAETGVSVAVPAVPGASLTSPNVTHIGTVPLEGVGVSMKVLQLGPHRRAYVSGAAGLSIYNADNPAAPRLLGHLPMYNWENEDIAVSADGRTAVMTEFTLGAYLHVVDVSDPTLPRLVGSLIPGGDHTVQCADPRCNYLYGSEGNTYDLRDRANPKRLPSSQSWGALVGVRDSHALHQDEAGVWISDSSPLVVFRQTRDPLHLTVLTRGTITKDTAYQHNNIRPRALQYRPRNTFNGPMRPGELLLGEGESGLTEACNGRSGAFSSWRMVGFERGEPMYQLDVLRPVKGKAAGVDPIVDAMACSGHWFTTSSRTTGKIQVAAAWYEHGTRFLEVDPATGKISQVGYFQPQRGAASQAYWIPGTPYIWTLDYHSGIDILKYNDRAPLPKAAAIEQSWLSKAGVVDPLAEATRELCRAGAKATEQQHHRALGLARELFS